MTELIMLGTGHATVTECYNTCFALKNEQGVFMCDAGGGSLILSRVKDAGIDWRSVHTLFLTHGHTDHILGVIWVIRMINTLMKQDKYEGEFHIYSLEENIDFLIYSCAALLEGKVNDRIVFHKVSDGDSFTAIGLNFAVFDIFSTKKNQLGFTVNIPVTENAVSGNADPKSNCQPSDELSSGTSSLKLTCLGDEPFNEKCLEYVEGTDWLLSEAFCLYDDREIFQPYRKHHSTAKDAGELAARLNVNNLVLYHTEDTDLEHRFERYSQEAALAFRGRIFVPRDLEVIELV